MRVKDGVLSVRPAHPRALSCHPSHVTPVMSPLSCHTCHVTPVMSSPLILSLVTCHVIQGPLSIRVEPEPLVVPERGLAVFKVQAMGLEPLTYQWYKDGVKVRERKGKGEAVMSPTLTLHLPSLLFDSVELCDPRQFELDHRGGLAL